MQIKDIIKDVKSAKAALEFSQKSVTIFGSARLNEDNVYFSKAYELANKLSNQGFAIITGGGGGVMRAANKGAYDSKKSPSIGLNVVLPNEQKINEFVTGGAVFSALVSRKTALMAKSDFFVIFPGGFGTLDELFEVLVLVQIGFKSAKIYLFDTNFWKPLIEFFKLSLIPNKTISPNDLQFLTLANSIEEIVDDILSYAAKDEI